MYKITIEAFLDELSNLLNELENIKFKMRKSEETDYLLK